jgi:hypothetical protein
MTSLNLTTISSRPAINWHLDLMPMRCNIQWVKGHQIDHKEWDQLNNAAKVNYYANNLFTKMQQNNPNWTPGLHDGLLHHGCLITKKQDKNVITSATACTKVADRHV